MTFRPRLVTCAVLVLLPSLGQSQSNTDEPWLRCRSVGDSAARLACYDAVKPAGSANAAMPSAAPVPATAARATPAAPAVSTTVTSDQAFGLEQRTEVQASSLRSGIPGIFEGWGASTVFKLANGQSWRVSDGSSAYYRLKDPVVTIKRAAMGSYLMDIAGVNQSIRVRRVE